MTRTPTPDHSTWSKACLVLVACLAVAALLPLHAYASTWNPTLLVNTEAFSVIDDSDTAGDPELRFGDTLNERLFWNRASNRFEFTDDLVVQGGFSASGALSIEGNAILQGTLSGASTVTLTNLKSCDTIDTNSAGVLVCGTDGGGGGGISQAAADARYVNQHGDTMTGTLTIKSTSGATAVGLRVVGGMSGSFLRISGPGAVHGALSASGQVVAEGGFSGSTLFVSTAMSGAGLSADCDGETQTLNWDATTERFTCLTDGGGGGGGISQSDADARYVNQSGDTMTGSLIITRITANIVKTSSGTSLATDFSLAGSLLTNVTSQNDTLTINEGPIPASGLGTISTSTVTTQAAIGAGGFTILREDGKYIIVHGNSTAVGSIWDGSTTGAMSASSTAPSTASIGAGAIALKRPDGRYLVINGAAALTTALFDPRGITATAAGTSLPAGCTASTGTNAFLRPDGKYVILCGGTINWVTYDPTANTYSALQSVGATLTFSAGAHAIMRDDGTFLVFRGGNTTTHWLYNPFASATGTMTQDPITTTPPTITTGAFSIRRKDGKFLVMGGAVSTSSIYDPTPTSANSGAGSMTAQTSGGFGPTAALADGAQGVWRQDGKYLLIIGAASTVTNIVDPSQTGSSQFTSGPALPAAPGAGVHLIMRPNGQYQIIRGGATTTTDNYDMGYVIGGNTSGVQLASYETECITSTALSQSGSRLFWTANQEGTMWFQAKTGNGACSGSYKDVRENGDYIRPAAGDNRVQVKVFFKRQFPNFADQEWKLRRGLGQTVYRQVNPDPTLYDLTVDNSTMVHRTQFEFGNSKDPSGPIGINIVNDRDKQLAIALAAGVGYGSTINASNALVYNGAWGTHPILTTTAADGTVVMRRPDGKFIVISGNTTTANAQVYDPVAQTFTALGTTPAAGTGLGALAFKRSDGKFLIVLGNATTTTSIFDPIANTFTAGPALTAAAGRGALVIPLPNGRVLIMHGNFTATSSIYDPYQNTMRAGPISSVVVGGGSMAIPRPDGTYLFIPGIATSTCTALITTTNNFNPYTMAFVATGSPAMTTGGTGPGAFAFQRSDGQWLIVKGGATVTTCAGVNTTMLYNPFANKIVAGPTTSGVVQNGAHAIPRPDGSWIIVHAGAALTTTSIYLERAGAFTSDAAGQVGAGLAATTMLAGPALVTGAGPGSISFQRDDGRFVTIIGNAGTVTHQYDAGWVDRGVYKSEQISVADLDSSSTLTWKGSPDMSGISAEARTAASQLALQTAVSREVPYSGAPINPGTGETWVRVHFNFKRTFPSYSGIFTDAWSSPNPFPWRPVATPTLTEFRITKDKDLINLQSNSRSIFRVNSDGDILTGPTSSILTGGADIAERYTAAVPLQPGEVVAVDPGQPHGVRRSHMPYQPDVLGIVSRSPGLVAGAYTVQSYPIALLGRVPVKVTDEGGPIRIGDRLTSSSLRGRAMRARQGGRVLGMALEHQDFRAAEPCGEDTEIGERHRCAEVTIFVDLSDYPGPSPPSQ